MAPKAPDETSPEFDADSGSVMQAAPKPTGGEGAGAPGTRRKRGGGVGTRVAFILGIITAVTGIVTFVFADIDPRLAPCLDGADASFTGAPVFPHTSYEKYEEDLGMPPAKAKRLYSHFPAGDEVRYSIHTSDLRGQALYLYTTLVKVNRDGTIDKVVRGQDLVYQFKDIPNDCSQDEGAAILVVPPPGGRSRYRIILELYLGPTFYERLALSETATFDS